MHDQQPCLGFLQHGGNGGDADAEQQAGEGAAGLGEARDEGAAEAGRHGSEGWWMQFRVGDAEHGDDPALV